MSKYLFPLLLALLITTAPAVSGGQTITTIAGTGIFSDGGDGTPATLAGLEYAWFVTVDTAGRVYITDNFDHRVRMVNTGGLMSTFAGNGSAGFSGDGGLAVSAQFIGAAGIATDAMGNTYFADISNRRVRKVDASGIITTIAGIGSIGFTGDGGPATMAQLNTPYGLAADQSGNVYVADELNYRVRKINAATGIITTIAGNGTAGYSGDGGPATMAAMTPTGLALDLAGNLYIATNNRIRKVDTAGRITTMAGNGVAGFSGDGLPAATCKLNQPIGVSVDGLGNVYIADQYNYRIRKVDRTGIINTIAGDGTGAYTGDGGPASAAEVKQPLGICTDLYGDIYFSDYGNYRVRKIAYGNHRPTFTHRPLDSMAVCENSVGDSLNALLTITDTDTGQTETWSVFQPATHGTAIVGGTALSTGGAVTPTGLSYTPTIGYIGFDTLKVRVDDGKSMNTITVYLRVKPLPDTGLVSGNVNVCIGTPDTLTSTASGGVWSAVNGDATISSTGILNGITMGIDTILHTYTQEGCPLASKTMVTVYPTTDSFTGPPAVCTGLSVVLDGLPAGGAFNVTNTLASVAGSTVFGDTAGIDTVIYTISNVCGIFSFTRPITVIGFTIPGVAINAYPRSIVAGQADTLVTSVTSGGGITYGYQWVINTHTIPGATDSTFICDTLHENDSVTCFITNGPCFFSTFSWIYITYHTVGISAINAEPILGLFPNPNTGLFTLSGTTGGTEKEVNIAITDVLGRTVYTGKAPANNGLVNHQIALADLPGNGVYTLQVSWNGGRKVMQFVVGR